MKKLKAKLPFGERVNANIARQSCRSRCNDTIWLANSRSSKSKLVFQDADHFRVSAKRRSLMSDVCRGTRYAGAPDVVLGSGSTWLGVDRQFWYKKSFTFRNGSHTASGSWSMMRSPFGGRGRLLVNVKDASHPCVGGTRNCEPRAAWPATGCEENRCAIASRSSVTLGSCDGCGLRSGTARPKSREITVKGF